MRLSSFTNCSRSGASKSLTKVAASRLRCDCTFFWMDLRSEEHTSELQSRLHLVCRLLLEKKKHAHLLPIHDLSTLLHPPRAPCPSPLPAQSLNLQTPRISPTPDEDPGSWPATARCAQRS